MSSSVIAEPRGTLKSDSDGLVALDEAELFENSAEKAVEEPAENDDSRNVKGFGGNSEAGEMRRRGTDGQGLTFASSSRGRSNPRFAI